MWNRVGERVIFLPAQYCRVIGHYTMYLTAENKSEQKTVVSLRVRVKNALYFEITNLPQARFGDFQFVSL